MNINTFIYMLAILTILAVWLTTGILAALVSAIATAILIWTLVFHASFLGVPLMIAAMFFVWFRGISQ